MSTAVFAMVALGLASIAALAAIRALVLGYPPPVIDKASLTRREQAVVAACADALFPAGGPIPLSGTEAGLVRYMDSYVGRAARRSGILIRILLVFIEYGPLLFGPRRRRFTRLSPEEREKVLVDMAESKMYLRRVAFLSIRTMLSMGYLANDAVAARIGMRLDRSPFDLGGDAQNALAPKSVRPNPRNSERPPSAPPPAGVAA